eukprot:531650-Amphidinium_carterae.3
MEMQQSHDEPNAQSHEHGPVRYRLRGTHRCDPVTGDLIRTRNCQPTGDGNPSKNFSLGDTCHDS